MAKKASLLDQQEKVVRNLQDRLLAIPSNADAGQVSTLAGALQIAVGAFDQLRPKPRAPWQSWASVSAPSRETTREGRERAG